MSQNTGPVEYRAEHTPRVGSRPTRPSRTTVPERCHPLAKVVFAEMRRQNRTYDSLEWDSGVLRSTFKSWRTHSRPGLDTISAALGALGWDVLPVPKAETLPPELRADLEALADRHGVALPCLALVSAVVGRPLYAGKSLTPIQPKRIAA